ncbi:hypothetical protein ATE84_4083 [Aquimarina sp. MAR_2010_214]|uniref:hypothetical protein n=1 Tax=Aquimarina sp. MAR_2010_214 TaxID=1250026 RepID=UPI000C70B99B|nr:hypothetical protein [Aquimarina sp. MAR_2010_214]PKV51983.1 hypothetical protein ATE84_4083 [Aquimarina sp. MAR_2010_214]
MKTLNNLKMYLVLIGLALCIGSCEKSELNVETPVIEQEEGFKSLTENSDSKLENLSDEKPIFHMKYRGDLTEKEVNARFAKDAGVFMKEYKKKNKGVSTEWFYRIVTHTGTQTNNDTDAKVRVRVQFKTNKGNLNAGWKDLNNPGDDREKGDWDFYILRTAYPGQAVSWVEVDRACLALQGKDGWFVTHFYAQVYSSIQSISSSGYSRIISTPNVWLDNSTSSGWDYYCNGNDVGRLNF